MVTSPSPAPRRGPPWVFAAVLLVLSWYVYATWRVSPGLVTHRPQAYYELLTEAVLAGRTYLDLEPDPRLATLANPWAGPQGIPRAHDATYFKGRYYIYFGVSPVILLLAPWRLVTGTYLTEAGSIGVFVAIGFLLAAWLYLRFRRRCFPELSEGATAVGVLTLGLGSFLQFEIWGTQFYQVPIVCAFVCGLGAAHAVFSAAAATRVRTRFAAMALASFFAGAAVGARPNFIVLLVPLAVVGWWLSRRQADRRTQWAVLIATALPAAVVGAALAGYNYARFGEFTEFGLRHQFAAIDMHHYKLFGPENLGPASFAYVLSPPLYSLYYPFIRPSGDTFGFVPWAPFALGAFVLPFLTSRKDAVWRLALGFCLALGILNLITLCFYAYYLERYEMDFLAWLMFVAVVGGSAVWASGKCRGGWRVAMLAPLVWTAVHSFVYAWPDRPDWPEVRAIARTLNRGSALLERSLGLKHGPVAMTVYLRPGAPGRREPLLSTAHGWDVVFVQYGQGERYRFGFTHSGEDGFLSEEFTAKPDQPVRLEVDLGGFYPPKEHPLFRDWAQPEVDLLRRRVVLRVDGRVLLRAESAFYASDPLEVRAGRARPTWRIQPRFTGRIEQVTVGALPLRSEIASAVGQGPVRLRLKFPSFLAMVGEPLISTGRHGAGDLVYGFRLSENRLRFAHDSWGSGLFESEPVDFDPMEEHVVDVDFGGLHPVAAPGAIGQAKLIVRFDGREVVNTVRPFNPARAAEVAFGYNAIRASTADPLFRGEKILPQRLDALPPAEPDSGPLALTLRLPVGPTEAEPLVVSGRTGAADFVYLVYRPDGHIQIGYDHWGVGGSVSEPVEVPAGEPVLVQVSLPALYRSDSALWRAVDAATKAAMLSGVRVRVNGRKVLDVPVQAYPATPAEVYVAANPVGGSTCGPRFTGEIVRSQRIEASAGW